MARDQVTHRCYAETSFQKFASCNLQGLRGLSKADLVKEFAGLKVNPRQTFLPTGMRDLLCKLLTVLEPICLMQRCADLTLLHRLTAQVVAAGKTASSIRVRCFLNYIGVCTCLVKLTVLMQDFCKQTCD